MNRSKIECFIHSIFSSSEIHRQWTEIDFHLIRNSNETEFTIWMSRVYNWQRSLETVAATLMSIFRDFGDPFPWLWNRRDRITAIEVKCHLSYVMRHFSNYYVIFRRQWASEILKLDSWEKNISSQKWESFYGYTLISFNASENSR